MSTVRSQHRWAHGRAWKHVHQPHPTERVAVELDGPNHRGMPKHTGDLSRVLAMIEGLLVARRRDEGIPREDRAR